MLYAFHRECESDILVVVISKKKMTIVMHHIMIWQTSQELVEIAILVFFEF